MLTQVEIKKELDRRKRVSLGPVEGGMFPAQRKAYTDTHSRVAIQCTARAGKSFGYYFSCLADEQAHCGASYIYIAKTLDQARGVWHPVVNELLPIWGGRWLKSEAKIELPNGGQIILFGADKEGIGDALHGLRLRKIMLDECAFYGIDLKYLIFEVLEPRIADSDGQMILGSTPGLFPLGFFWEVTSGERKGWNVYRWSYRDNPHVVEKMQKFIDKKIEEDPSIVDTPAFRRNYLNEWVVDSSNRVYKFNPEKNTVKEFTLDEKHECHYILGLDLGYDDASAFVVGAYRKNLNKLWYLVAEKQAGLNISEIAKRCKMFMEVFPRLHIVGDVNKKQILDELQRRHGLPVMPTEKVDKVGWQQLMNADFENGVIQIVEDECQSYIEELADLTYKEYRNGRKVESPGQANDCCDAALYVYRHAYHYRAKPSEPRPSVGTAQYHEALSARLEREADEALIAARRENEDWYD